MASNKKIYNLGVLASGNGSNLQAIIDAINTGNIKNAKLVVVVSNKKNARALKRSKMANIESLFINPANFASDEEYDKQILKIMISYQVDLILLAGYIKIITLPLLNHYHKRILNIHPSLLPEFGGVKMYGMKVHEAVIAKGVKRSGCTVHVVSEDVDMGPVIDQVVVKVLETDTKETLAARVLQQEHILYPEVINKYIKSLNKE